MEHQVRWGGGRGRGIQVTCCMCPYRYCRIHFVDVNALQTAQLPLSPGAFEELIRQQCVEARSTLQSS